MIESYNGLSAQDRATMDSKLGVLVDGDLELPGGTRWLPAGMTVQGTLMAGQARLAVVDELTVTGRASFSKLLTLVEISANTRFGDLDAGKSGLIRFDGQVERDACFDGAAGLLVIGPNARFGASVDFRNTPLELLGGTEMRGDAVRNWVVSRTDPASALVGSDGKAVYWSSLGRHPRIPDDVTETFRLMAATVGPFIVAGQFRRGTGIFCPSEVLLTDGMWLTESHVASRREAWAAIVPYFEAASDEVSFMEQERVALDSVRREVPVKPQPVAEQQGSPESHDNPPSRRESVRITLPPRPANTLPPVRKESVRITLPQATQEPTPVRKESVRITLPPRPSPPRRETARISIAPTPVQEPAPSDANRGWFPRVKSAFRLLQCR